MGPVDVNVQVINYYVQSSFSLQLYEKNTLKLISLQCWHLFIIWYTRADMAFFTLPLYTCSMFHLGKSYHSTFYPMRLVLLFVSFYSTPFLSLSAGPLILFSSPFSVSLLIPSKSTLEQTLLHTVTQYNTETYSHHSRVELESHQSGLHSTSHTTWH